MYNDTNLEAMRTFYLAKNTAFLPCIEKDVADLVIADLARLAMEKPDYIPLVISSTGGLTSEGFKIAQFIEFELNIPVHAQVFGECYSAATYALMCCTERVSNELTTFLLHHHTSEIKVEYSADFKKNARGWVKENEKIYRAQVRFYSQKLGLTKKNINKILSKGSAETNTALSAKDALKIGLLTKINTLSKSS